MRPHGRLLILAAVCCLMALAVSIGQVGANDGTEGGGGGVVEQQQRFRLPKLFDFQYFKQRFGKRYRSLVEELSRRTYFVARAFRAFVSGMNYKYRKSSYYLAVNHLSDASPVEIEARKNKLQAKANGRLVNENEKVPKTTKPTASELPEFIPGEGEDYESGVSKLLEKHANEPGYRELLEESKRAKRDKRRRERDAGKKPRDFSFDALIKPGVDSMPRSEPEAVRAKMTNNIQGNNQHYQGLEFETRGLNDNHVDLIESWLEVPSKHQDKRRVDAQLEGSLNKLRNFVFTVNPDGTLNYPTRDKFVLGELEEEEQEEEEYEQKDVMYFDHRDSNCLLQPRDQGNCGSCYAFASMAQMEWLHCMKTGKLVQFSEQYLVDCGKNRWNDNMDGCEGATDWSVFKFIQNFGLELGKRYPYLKRELKCPYPEETDLRAVGYIRMNLKDFLTVPIALWPEMLQHGPLYMSIASPPDFEEYSGGVHDGQNCVEDADHAQLLIGHGREDGKDYWLIRNSFGPNWGDNGNFKLSKDAPRRCIYGPVGYTVGTIDGRNYHVRPKKNRVGREFRRELMAKAMETRAQ